MDPQEASTSARPGQALGEGATQSAKLAKALKPAYEVGKAEIADTVKKTVETTKTVVATAVTVTAAGIATLAMGVETCREALGLEATPQSEIAKNKFDNLQKKVDNLPEEVEVLFCPKRSP